MPTWVPVIARSAAPLVYATESIAKARGMSTLKIAGSR